MRLACSVITWGGLGAAAEGITSVTQLTYATRGPVVDAIHEIAKMGYEGIEAFDGDVLSRRVDIAAALETSGMELVSVYTGANFIYADAWGDEISKIKRVADVAASLGATYLVVGGGAKRSEGEQPCDLEKLASGLDTSSEIAANRGLLATYHPHAGTTVERYSQLARLLPLTSVSFCADTAHLALGGSLDDAMTLLSGRLGLLHFKDLDAASKEFRPLGQGDINLARVIAILNQSQYDGWIVVELDQYADAPQLAAQDSKDFMTRAMADG